MKLNNVQKSGTLIALLFSLAGCTSIHVKMTKPDGTQVEMQTRVPLFANGIVKNMQLDGATKTTSSLFKITSGSVEPNAESIQVSGEALGNVIGQAIATGAKGIK